MPHIIKDGEIIDDGWLLMRLEEGLPAPAPDAAEQADVIIPLSLWRDSAEWRERKAGRTGVWLGSDEAPDLFPGDWNDFPLVAVDFPAFTDGRGYSIGRLLRERYNYAGELRAIGDVWKDQLAFLWQVGFNAFEIKHGKPVEDALAALKSFTGHYQSTWRQPEPLFRRGIK